MSDVTTLAAKDDPNVKIECKLDGAMTHSISLYLKNHHPSVSIEEYKERFPDAPILSEFAQERIRIKKEENKEIEEAKRRAEEEKAKAFDEKNKGKKPLFEVFGFDGKSPGMKQTSGSPVMIDFFEKSAIAPEAIIYIPEIDTSYVFREGPLKCVLLGLDMNIPTYLWGPMGTGKSTLFEQACALTGRPAIRIQHSRDTEQSHIVGQTLVKDGATFFELGPLAFAMKYGLVYIADEYDFAMPAVLSTYQAVLEGKPLIIKEADAENRVIHPHPNFRIVATGNTNGSGDETGLYQGTVVQNAANYERFGIVIEAEYMDSATESRVVVAKTGIDKEGADNLVKFANLCRESYRNGEISLPMSPRSLINAARVGIQFANLNRGLNLAYIARLDSGSRQVASEIAGRIFR